MDLGASVSRSGIKKVVLVNGHGGNCDVMSLTARRLRSDHGLLCVVVNGFRGAWPVSELWGDGSDEARYGIHGGGVETSLMLAVRGLA